MKHVLQCGRKRGVNIRLADLPHYRKVGRPECKGSLLGLTRFWGSGRRSLTFFFFFLWVKVTPWTDRSWDPEGSTNDNAVTVLILCTLFIVVKGLDLPDCSSLKLNLQMLSYRQSFVKQVNVKSICSKLRQFRFLQFNSLHCSKTGFPFG